MQMQISSAPLLTAAKLAELVALGHNRISQIYLVSALFTRRRGNEPRRAGHQGQGPVVCKKQPPCLKGLLFKEHDVFF